MVVKTMDYNYFTDTIKNIFMASHIAHWYGFTLNIWNDIL
jgi:hypothetical protein